MNPEELNAQRVPVVRIDNTLKKYQGQSLTPEKLAKANEMLRKVGLPKEPGAHRQAS